MSKKNDSTSKPLRTGFWILMGIMGIWILILGGNSFFNTWKLQRQVGKLKAETMHLKAVNDSLSQENQRLKTDPEAAEKAAREKFGLTKPGETVIRFVPAKDDEEAKK